MISVEEAKTLLKQKVVEIGHQFQRTEQLPLEDALNRILAEPIIAPISLPLFDNSAMDGFAIRAFDTQTANTETPLSFTVNQATRAGDPPLGLSNGLVAIRIMTGAPIPMGADAVVKKEDVLESGKNIYLTKPVTNGQNVRYSGEEIQAGEEAITAKTHLTPGVIGFLASLGITSVPVIAAPRVSLLVTGHELVISRDDLHPGKILDANTPMLKALLKEMGISGIISKALPDDTQRIKNEIAAALEISDILILTGGVSVGDHDHTRPVLEQLGVQELFWKVAQKPGKPLYVGSLQNKLIFGLPGNPYSTLACFCVYVRPTLRMLMGYTDSKRGHCKLKTCQSIRLDATRAQFLKAQMVSIDGIEQVQTLSGQGAHLLRAFTQADCLICVPAGLGSLPEGFEVDVLPL